MSTFSVHQFFSNGTNETVRENVTAEDAVRAARHYMTSVGAQIGTTQRVIITDNDDFVTFEWRYEKGIVYL